MTGGALLFGLNSGSDVLLSGVGLVMALVSVLWAWGHHEGAQILATSMRKTLAAVPGFLLAMGWVSVDTAGLLASFLAPLFAIVWSFIDKGGKIPESAGKVGALMFALLALGASGCLTSCEGLVASYTVDGSGLDWEENPVQELEPSRVVPNVDVPLPEKLGGGSITVPIVVAK